MTGMAAVFPVAFTSFAFLVLPRAGGTVGAAIMVSALRAMPGFALALLTLHLTAVPLGVGAALAVAMTRVYLSQAIEKVESAARKVIAATAHKRERPSFPCMTFTRCMTVGAPCCPRKRSMIP